jgi:glycosyltransferase involved in cell wall biosynthesis
MGRILHLISQLEEGGAQRLLSNVIALSHRHQVEVASLISSPESRLFPFFRNCNIPIHFLSNSGDFYYPGILPTLRKLLKERRYNLVQCWLFESIVQGILACRVENVPCIAFPHSMRLILKLNRHKLWERICIRKAIVRADLTLFPSYTTAIDFLHAGWVDLQKIRVAQNGVDCAHFQSAGHGDALVAVGRLSSEKGFEFLAKLVRRLRNDFPKLRCIVAGGGKGSLPPEFEHVGYVEDVREVYRMAAVYISTSWVEGLSVALLEAQAMGVPAVVRRIGSNSEVIEHGLNGFLAQSEEEYVVACKELLEDADLRHSMAAKARDAAVARFSIEKQVREMESIHDEFL